VDMAAATLRTKWKWAHFKCSNFSPKAHCTSRDVT